MADVVKAISGNVIKNGSLVLIQPKNSYSNGIVTENSYVSNSPTIEQIQDKYDNRFDDTGYYTA